jgi:hypothetical protein
MGKYGKGAMTFSKFSTSLDNSDPEVGNPDERDKEELQGFDVHRKYHVIRILYIPSVSNHSLFDDISYIRLLDNNNHFHSIYKPPYLFIPIYLCV